VELGERKGGERREKGMEGKVKPLPNKNSGYGLELTDHVYCLVKTI